MTLKKGQNGILMSKIEFQKGNLLESKAEALVNTVNTVGVMGKGIALLFKRAYPENYTKYKTACRKHEVKIGQMFNVRVGVNTYPDLFGQETDSDESKYPQWIINFPTKQHWRGSSKLQWIEDGLEDLKKVIEKNKIRTVALPQLGCGNGGLNWRDVEPSIHKAFADLKEVRIIVYESPAEIFR